MTETKIVKRRKLFFYLKVREHLGDKDVFGYTTLKGNLEKLCGGRKIQSEEERCLMVR
jgi:hypothetical protein